MGKISEYDRRQLKLMMDVLSSFEDRKIDLGSLVGSLVFLLNAMEYIEEEREEEFLDTITHLESIDAINIIKENDLNTASMSWKGGFRAECNSIELIQDSIENGSISEWRGDFREEMQQSVSKLKGMVRSLVEEYLKTSDPNISDSAIIGDHDWLVCSKCYDAWECNPLTEMVICPKCQCALHNPRINHEE